MASYVTPKINTQYIFYIGLTQQADTRLLQVNPTIAAGDFKVSIDGGTLNNPATLPVVTPAGSRMVKVTLSASEMNGDNITLVCSDAAGAEWCDQLISIQTSARQIDDLAFPTTSGRSIDVATTGEVGLDFDNIKAASGATTLTNITVPIVTTVSGNVNGNVGGNVTGNLGGTLTSTERNAIADALLNRSFDVVSDTNDHTVINALRVIRNWAIAANVLTAYKENGTTPAWTQTLTLNAAASPITAADSTT